MLKNNKYKSNIKGGMYIGIFFAVVLAVVLYSNSDKLTHSDDDKNIVTYSWTTYLKQVHDNYDIDVRVDNKEEASTINMNRENESYQISTGDFEHKLMLKYKNKWYYLDDYELKSMKNSKIDEVYNFRYMDYELIAQMILRGTILSDKNNIMKMELSLSNFLKEYNYLYNENNKTDLDEKITMEIKYNTRTFDEIVIDYSKVEDYFKNTKESSLKYTITVNSLNDVYFETTIEEYFKLTNKKEGKEKLKEFLTKPTTLE